MWTLQKSILVLVHGMQLIAIIFVDIFPYKRDERTPNSFKVLQETRSQKARYHDKQSRRILEDKLVYGEGPVRI